MKKLLALFSILLIDEEVKSTFLYLSKSYIFAPSSIIILMSLIFLADLFIFFSVSLSETIKTFDKLFSTKNLLNSFVFFISFFTSDNT